MDSPVAPALAIDRPDLCDPVRQTAIGKGTARPWSLFLEVVQAAAGVSGSSVDPASARCWRGDPRLVRFGTAVAAALRYALLPVGVIAMDQQRAAALARAFGLLTGDLLDNKARLVAFLLDRAVAARAACPPAAEGALV